MTTSVYCTKWLPIALLICSIFATGCGGHSGGGGSGIALAVSVKHNGVFAAGASGGSFAITVSNVGTLATQAVITVSDNLSSGLYFLGGENLCSFTNSNQNATCTVQSSIVAGASFQIVLPVGVGAVPPGPIASTVTASSGGNTASATDSVFVNTCGSALGNEALLQGHYVFLAQGFDVAGSAGPSPAVLVLSFTADGHGNITAGEADLNNSTGPQHLSINSTGSSYTAAASNVCLQLAYSGGATASALFRFTVGGISNGIVSKGWGIGFDGNFVSGILRLQDPTAFSLSQLQANFALGADGVDASGRHVALAGFFNSSSGAIQYDLDEGGPLGTTCNGTGLIASVSSVDGRGLLTLTPGCGFSTSAHEAIYVVNAHEFFFIQVDRFGGGLQFGGGSSILSGRAIAAGSSFSAATLNGNYILHMTGQTGSAAQVSLALLTFTPGGGNTGRVGGTLFSYSKAGGGTTTAITGENYSVDPLSGRVTFSGTAIGTLVAYLATPTDGVSALLVGEPDDALGLLEFQPTQTYTTASVAGSYLLGTEDPGDSTVTEQTGPSLVGTTVAPGSYATAPGPLGTATAAAPGNIGGPASPFAFGVLNINSDGTGNLTGASGTGVAITNGTKIFLIVETVCGSLGCFPGYPAGAAVINVLEK